MTIQKTIQATRMTMEKKIRGPVFHDPCPTCDPNNRFGYVCPVPVPTAPGQQIPRDFVVQGHQFCGFCGNLMPVRGIVEEVCASCSTYSCNSILAKRMSRFDTLEIWRYHEFQFLV